MNQPEFDFNAAPKKDAADVPASLLEKIKKLLRLASSDNPHEAALAMSRAMAMADHANLDLSTLRDDEEVGEIVEHWIPVGSRLTREAQLALGIVQTYFNVGPVVFKSRASVVFIGQPADIAVAEYVYGFLVATVRRCLKAYEDTERKARRRTRGAKRANFIAGFYYGIATTLGQQRQTLLVEDRRFAIILADQAQAREDYSATHLGATKAVALRKPRRNRSALASGYRDGRNTQISPALSPNASPLALA
jgi:hypothetical protein